MKLALAGLLLVTVLTYHGVWSAGWVYEDSNAVQADPTALGQAPVNWMRTRSLAALSHRLVYRAVGDQPRVHHLVNLGLHLVNGSLVYAIAAVFLTPIGALVTAAVFLLHPLQSETVAYVASRSELLAATFALSAYALSLHLPSPQRASRRWLMGGLMWICVALALMAKESAIVIIPLIAITAVFRGWRMSIWQQGALILPAAGMAWTVFQYDYLSQSDLSRLDYLATQAYAVWRYVGLALLPIGQTVDHDFDVVSWSMRYVALVGLWALALIPLYAALTTEDEHHTIERVWGESRTLRLSAFGITWMLIALAPRFVLRLPELLSEHQTYLAFIGLWFCLGVFVDSVWQAGDALSTLPRDIDRWNHWTGPRRPVWGGKGL